MKTKSKGFTELSVILIAAVIIISGIFIYKNRSEISIDTEKSSTEIKFLNRENIEEESLLQQIGQLMDADVPKNWVKQTCEKPLNISLYSPSEYKVTKTESEQEVWGVNLESKNGMVIQLCVGCTLDSVIKTCGHPSGPEEEYVCKEARSKELPNGRYSMEVFKSNEDKLAHITGVLYKDGGEEILIMTTTENNRLPSEEEFKTLDTIFASVLENK